MIRFHVRVVCESENGDGKGWHYHRYTNDGTEADATQKCPTHPAAVHRDYVVKKTEEIAE